MARVVRELTNENLEDVTDPCRTCTFWEHRPGDRDIDVSGSGDSLEKEMWVSEVCLVHGSAGKVAYVDGHAAGFTLCGPREIFHGAELFPLKISDDALFLATVNVHDDRKDFGIGKTLVHATLREAKARGKKALEAYGDRDWKPQACIVPADFLEALGFKVKREHPRFPLYRLDLGSLASMSRNVEAAVDAFLDSVFAGELVAGRTR